MPPALNTRWLLSRIDLAERLAIDDGSYPDGVLILSSVISGIAAGLWPRRYEREGIDSKRFIELWVRYADESLQPALISVPLLAQELARDGEEDVARLLRRDLDVPLGWLDDAVLTGNQVDRSEEDILSEFPSLPRVKVRKKSYPSIFYSHFRSSYVHQYLDDELVDQKPMTDTHGDVIYTAFSTPPHRRVHFDFQWLARVGRSVVRSVESVYDSRPLERPLRWWVSG